MFLVLLSACAANDKITPELAEKVSTHFEYRENVFHQCRMRGLLMDERTRAFQHSAVRRMAYILTLKMSAYDQSGHLRKKRSVGRFGGKQNEVPCERSTQEV